MLGVDEFALRKGQVYASILLDMATHRPVDVLPDRTADTLAGWLKAHQGVEVVCRDRAGAYADGVRAGAPHAQQVADRWHLWANLGQALEKTVRAHRACLREPPDADAAPPAVEPQDTEPPAAALRRELLDAAGQERPLVGRTRERYAEVQELRASGMSLNAISRALGLAFRTTSRFTNAASAEELLVGTCIRASVLDAFKPYLTRRWNEGCTNASQLHAEQQAQEWKGSLRTVQGYLRPFRDQQQAVVEASSAVPKPRHLVTWIMTDPDHLEPHHQARLAELLPRCPELATAVERVRAFAKVLVHRRGHQPALEAWITATVADGDLLPQLVGFAAGLRRDLAAVAAGLTLPYSNGAVEGAVTRIEAIKRKLYGRANLDLLRKLILLG